eukprot:CAMPEP_0197328542 /NCGR_PEP_ID=MMETSP0892-20130614/4731_1 /TAXON_ID=44058 ORGANISM="Aureoumbra lagunensis, Strain CCMP1510" /NCGR_SAMPLE_ID=MMETSP0892 /ASSEMBLY_ACC=CAM_ASM_000538 /LENGTH=232 /DNA_ID=CAMNT_0042824579 /DNA_START=416 /DNA_END=1110 /DNA_ORIENTATION=+
MSGCHCMAHQPIPRFSTCPHLGIFRDPRFRIASHERYRAQVSNHKLPDKVNEQIVLRHLRTVDHDFERMFLRGGPRVSTHFVRNEVLSDPAIGFHALIGIDKFLGLPKIRKSFGIPPLTDNDAKDILHETSFSNMAEKCLKDRNSVNRTGYLGYDFRTAKQKEGCPVDRAVELYRAHAPKHDLADLLKGASRAASLLDNELLKEPLHKTLFGCYRPPACATRIRTLSPQDPR